MNLDLDLLRAFLVLAEERNFGRAATRLFLTQQGLSKRIQRLEAVLSTTLFTRDSRGVELTPSGGTLLSHAREVIRHVDDVAAVFHPERQPLRIDVWGHVQQPLHLIREVNARLTDVTFDISMRRGLPSALLALQRNEIDAAFGRVRDIGVPWPPNLSHRLVALEPGGAAMVEDDSFLLRHTVTVQDLRSRRLWLPHTPGAPEVVGQYRRFAEAFDLPHEMASSNLGLEYALRELGKSPRTYTLLGTAWPIPADARIRVVPIDPVPLFPWSIVWREDTQCRPLGKVVTELLRISTAAGRLDFDPGRHWVADVDREDLRAAQAR